MHQSEDDKPLIRTSFFFLCDMFCTLLLQKGGDTQNNREVIIAKSISHMVGSNKGEWRRPS